MFNFKIGRELTVFAETSKTFAPMQRAPSVSTMIARFEEERIVSKQMTLT